MKAKQPKCNTFVGTSATVLGRTFCTMIFVVERMPQVCSTVISAKGGYFESNIFDYFLLTIPIFFFFVKFILCFNFSIH